MPAAEPSWRRLEAGGALTTPYQRFDLLAAWQHHVGARAGVAPFIVTGFDAAGEPVFLWPFGRQDMGPLQRRQVPRLQARQLQLGLWRRDIVGGDRRGRHPRYFRPRRDRRPSRRPRRPVQPAAELGRARQPVPAAAAPGRGRYQRAATISIRRRHHAIETVLSLIDALAPAHQGTQAAEAGGLPLHSGGHRRRHRSPARRVLRAEGGAHGGARPHQRVRRAGRCRVPARGVPSNAPGRPAADRAARARRRRRGARAVRHHGRRLSLARRCSTPTRSGTTAGTAPA